MDEHGVAGSILQIEPYIVNRPINFKLLTVVKCQIIWFDRERLNQRSFA